MLLKQGSLLICMLLGAFIGDMKFLKVVNPSIDFVGRLFGSQNVQNTAPGTEPQNPQFGNSRAPVLSATRHLKAHVILQDEKLPHPIKMQQLGWVLLKAHIKKSIGYSGYMWLQRSGLLHLCWLQPSQPSAKGAVAVHAVANHPQHCQECFKTAV